MVAGHARSERAWHRARVALRQSLRVRLIVLFLLMALGITLVFVGSMRNVFGIGWRDLTRPLVADYVGRLVDEIGAPPDVAKARALAGRLPLSIRISGPQVNWHSLPDGGNDPWHHRRPVGTSWRTPEGEPTAGPPLWGRTTPDGHLVELALNFSPLGEQHRGIVLWTLGLMLLITALAYAYIRRLMRPLDDIRAGARRFGDGEFARPIIIRNQDELGTLAADVNAMAHDIHQMLDAKRSLLLAISHELRSPLTRARLNTELLPEEGVHAPQREALLRDLGEMRDLISDLLESERLSSRHRALALETQSLEALAREVLISLPGAPRVDLRVFPGLPDLPLDGGRIRLLIRNLVSNALRHAPRDANPPVLSIEAGAPDEVVLRLRDFGPGVEASALPHLAEAFYRPDAARARGAGGVGLGLYLCKLVVQAHDARWSLKNAGPGLEVCVRFSVAGPGVAPVR